MCLGQGADLHMAQLTTSCSSKSRLVLPFWCRLTQVVLDKIQEGRKMDVCVCACVCVCVRACVHVTLNEYTPVLLLWIPLLLCEVVFISCTMLVIVSVKID